MTQELVKQIQEATTDGMAAINADGRVIVNNFVALKYLPQLNLREVYHESARLAQEQPSQYIPILPSPVQNAQLYVCWLGKEQGKTLICIQEGHTSHSGLVSQPEQLSQTGNAQLPLQQKQGVEPAVRMGSSRSFAEDFSGPTESLKTWSSQPLDPVISHFDLGIEKPLQPAESSGSPSQAFTTKHQAVKINLGQVLNVACELSEMAAFSIDIETKETWWSESMYKLLNVNPREKPSMATLERYISSEHRHVVLGKLYQSIGEGEYFEEKFVFASPYDASLQNMMLRGKVYRDLYGAAQQVVAAILPDNKPVESNDNLQLSNFNHELNQLIEVIGFEMQEPANNIYHHITDVEAELGPLISPHALEILEHIKLQIAGIGKRAAALVNYATAFRTELAPTWVDTEALLDSALGSVENITQVRLELPDLWPTIYQDALGLQIALVQILSNAAKFAHAEKPIVKVSIVPKANGLYFNILDNGPGFEPEHLPHVFDLFYVTKSRNAGAGIGLTIAKKAISQLGGHISIQPDSGGTMVSLFAPGQVGPPKPKGQSISWGSR